jgi:DNA-directed RNA polymerase specialized sigma24 family protein
LRCERYSHDSRAVTDVFDSAVGRLYDEIAGVANASGADLSAVTSHLQALLRRQFGGTPHLHAEDAAQSAVVRFTAAVQRGGVTRETAPQFLIEIARNVGRDLARKDFRGRELPTEWSEMAPSSPTADDDEVARLLDRRADSERVRAALRQSVADGRHDIVRIVRAWLNLASLLGRAPSSREVGAQVGLSHTTVQTALAAFRGYFPPEDEAT